MPDQEFFCNTCDAGPFGLHEKGNVGLIVDYHKNQGHEVIEYHVPESKDIFEREIWNDEDRENFKKSERKAKFITHETVDREKITILQGEIKILRPITLDDSLSRYILAYMPAKIDGLHGETARKNIPFFVVKNTDGTKQLLNSKDPELSDFVTNPLLEYHECRWKPNDVMNYLDEIESINPKLAYESSIQNIKKYFDHNDDSNYDVCVLWNIHTYFSELFNTTPYLDFTGTKRAAKSKNLDYQKLLCFNAVKSSDISPSSLFRLIESNGATILLDETEHFKHPKSEKHQDMIAMLHTGFMKGDSAIRTEGQKGNFTTREFRTFGPKSLAHINAFSDVLEDRCIPIVMLRSTDKDILNSDPDKSDPQIIQLRNWYYRLFLDYADEIFSFISEARQILNVSSRELKIWTPIITLALFFEKHGVVGLTAKIKAKAEAVFEERSQDDEENSLEGRFLRFISIEIRPLQKKDGILQFKFIMDKFQECREKYGFEDYHKDHFVSDKLKKLGFPKLPRKSQGSFYDLSDEKINSALTRMSIPYQTKLTDEDNDLV